MELSNFLAGGILLIIGLINLTGKATFMIAGYNTMSPGQQARRDIKKISRFLGWMLIICALVLIIGGVFSQWGVFSNKSIMISWGLFLVIIPCGVVYMNMSKRFKIDVIQINTDKLSRQMGLKAGLITGLAVLIVAGGFTAYLLAASSKQPVYTISDTSLKISGMYGEAVAISDIRNMELKNSLPINLIKTNGAALGSMLKGNFESYGTKMKVFADASKPPFIYLYTSKETVILNGQSADKTEALYQELQNKTSGGQAK